LVVFKVPDNEVKTMTELYRIAEREGRDVKDVMVQAVKEYVELHGPGNSQTLIPSFVLGGIKSDGQIEQQIVKHYLSKREARYLDVVRRVREAGFPDSKVIATVNKVIKQLIDSNVKVWR